MALLVLSVIPAVFATSIGTGIGVDIVTEDFAPLVWMCDHRVVLDDAVQWGRVSKDDQGMLERGNNYAFEGEQIGWKVLVMDKNGVEKIEDVFATIGDVQGEGNDIEVNCQESNYEKILDSCNARIGEEYIDRFDDDTMQYYWCTLTVETQESMYGEYWITVEALDLDGLSGTMDENEYWFLNPNIALTIDGDLVFEDVRPGTDFYDSSSSGAMCPTTNQLELDNFRYFATSGAYSTATDDETDSTDPKPINEGIYDVSTDRDRDVEGYVNIQHGDHFDRSMYYEAEIMQSGWQLEGPGPAGYYRGNILTPGAEMALTFKLSLPEPCNGDFDTGSIYFWGEAI